MTYTSHLPPPSTYQTTTNTFLKLPMSTTLKTRKCWGCFWLMNPNHHSHRMLIKQTNDDVPSIFPPSIYFMQRDTATDTDRPTTMQFTVMRCPGNTSAKVSATARFNQIACVRLPLSVVVVFGQSPSTTPSYKP